MVENIYRILVVNWGIVISTLLVSGAETYERSNWRSIVEHVGVMPGSEAEVIERYHDNRGRATPVVFRGVGKRMDTLNKADLLPYVKGLDGDELILFPLEVGVDAAAEELRGDRSFEEYLDSLVSNSSIAEYFWTSVDEPKTEAYEHYESTMSLPDYFNKENPFYALFVGPKKTNTRLHSHESVFLAQVHGKKRVFLVSPDHKADLGCEEGCIRWISYNPAMFDTCDPATSEFDRAIRPKISDNDQGCSEYSKYIDNAACRIDPITPKPWDYEVLKKVPVFEVVIEAGDVLYIPDGWLHEVHSLSTSVSIAKAAPLK